MYITYEVIFNFEVIYVSMLFLIDIVFIRLWPTLVGPAIMMSKMREKNGRWATTQK